MWSEQVYSPIGRDKKGNWKGSLLCSWGNWDTETASNLPKVTQLVSGTTKLQGSHKQYKQTLFLSCRPCSPFKILSHYSQNFLGSISCVFTNRSSQPDQLVRSLPCTELHKRTSQGSSLLDIESLPTSDSLVIDSLVPKLLGPIRTSRLSAWGSGCGCSCLFCGHCFGPMPLRCVLGYDSWHPWSHALPSSLTLDPKYHWL